MLPELLDNLGCLRRKLNLLRQQNRTEYMTLNHEISLGIDRGPGEVFVIHKRKRDLQSLERLPQMHEGADNLLRFGRLRFQLQSIGHRQIFSPKIVDGIIEQHLRV